MIVNRISSSFADFTIFSELRALVMKNLCSPPSPVNLAWRMLSPKLRNDAICKSRKET